MGAQRTETQDIELRCNCGAVRGIVQAVDARAGSHVICHCRDCQTFARHLGAMDVMDAHGGTGIFQTLPHRISFSAGQDQVTCLRLGPNGLLRWYAACCNTPLVNTMATQRLPFAGLIVAAIAPDDRAALGPVIARNSAANAVPPFSDGTNDFGIFRAVRRFMARAAGAYLTGKARRGPFFAPDGAPVVTPTVLSKQERAAAQPDSAT